MGFANHGAIVGMVRDWHHGRMRATRSQRAREILTELVPELLRIFGATAAPDTALRRFDEFLSRLPAGVQLFSLFHANPGLLRLVADLMAEAPLLAENLARRLGLLDAVLSEDFLAPLPRRAALAAELDEIVAAARDFEDTLDLLRRWANERRFQIGVQLLHRILDPAAAGGALADVAEAVLGALLPAVSRDFARAHGKIPGGEMAILAMGRLGSREMTPSSDLDLILIYDAPEERRNVGRHAAAGDLDLLRAVAASASDSATITAPTAEGRGFATMSTCGYTAAIGCLGADRDEPCPFRALPTRFSMDLGAYGADPGAPGGRCAGDGSVGASKRRSRRRTALSATPIP